MKKGKKLIKLLILSVLCVCMLMPAVACSTSSSSQVSSDEKTLNVRIYKGGYGTDYIQAVKTEFEKTFAEEGYKLNILAPDPELSATKVVNQVKENSGVDVYFGGGAVDEIATSLSGQIMEGSAALDITESVLNAKPIKFDKTEEDCTVLSKCAGDQEVISYDGKYYGLSYAQSIGGLAVNTKVLADYQLNIPKTTDEMFAAADKIMLKAKDTLVFPYTYSLSGNNYPIMMLQSWMLQYLGAEKYHQFQSMQVNGVNMEKPYEIWGSGADGSEGEFANAIAECLTAYYEVADPYAGSSGSRTQDFVDAQGDLMSGEAAFFAVGDWMFNEEYKRYTNNLNDITFVNMPVLSALGVKLGLCGATHNVGDKCASCDGLLSGVIALVDQNKTVDEIKAQYATLDTADIEAICKARGVALDRSGQMIWISKNTTKADIATTFLRFCASTECATLIAQNTRTNISFAPQALANTEYAWFNGVNAIINNRYANKVLSAEVYGLRKAYYIEGFSTLGTFVFVNLSEEMTKTQPFKSIYDGTTYQQVGNKSLYKDLAFAMQKKMYSEGKARVEKLQADGVGV